MTLNASQVRTAPNGEVFVAPLGTAEPINVATALNAAFEGLGYLTPDGISITPSVDQENINVWQSLAPVLTPITGMSLEISMTMAQVNRTTLGLYFLGTTWTTPAAGVGRLEIDTSPGTQERILVVAWEDNTGDKYRLVVPRAQMTNREALSLVRGDSTNMGLTFSALDDDGIAAYLLTDNSDLIPGA